MLRARLAHEFEPHNLRILLRVELLAIHILLPARFLTWPPPSLVLPVGGLEVPLLVAVGRGWGGGGDGWGGLQGVGGVVVILFILLIPTILAQPTPNLRLPPPLLLIETLRSMAPILRSGCQL